MSKKAKNKLKQQKAEKRAKFFAAVRKGNKKHEHYQDRQARILAESKLRHNTKQRHFGLYWDSHEASICLGRIQGNQNDWIRPAEDWSYKGKSEKSKLKSLIRHLFVKYEVPECFYKSFMGEADYVDLLIMVTQGGSMYQLLSTYPRGPHLTKKQCHLFLNMMGTKEQTILATFRLVQCISAQVEGLITYEIMRSVLSRNAYSRDAEKFIETVIHWFSKQAMFDSRHVGTIVDYLVAKQEQEPDYSMKGRGAAPLIEASRLWHQEFRANRWGNGYRYTPVPVDTKFEPCLIAEEGKYTIKNAGTQYKVDEILSYKGLRAEGAALRHCVSSYARSVKEGRVSIWSLKRGAKKVVTIELQNGTRCVVQARGVCNRKLDVDESTVLHNWANDNNLIVRAQL